MNTKKALITLLLLPVLFFFTFCKSTTNQHMKDEYQIIETKLDEAIMSQNPREACLELIPEISAYKSVDSVWLEGSNLWVKFKEKGKVSWFIPESEDSNTNTIDINE